MNVKNVIYVFISVIIFAIIYSLLKTYNCNSELVDIRETTIKVDNDTLFLGKINWGNKKKDKIIIENVGKNPLFINDVEVECNCISIEGEKRMLLPGRKCEIIIVFEASTYGKFNKGINIIGNIHEKKYPLKIIGEVLAPEWLIK